VEEKGRAAVIHKRGKYWSNFGSEKDKTLWLSPEEALYLVETVSIYTKLTNLN